MTLMIMRASYYFFPLLLVLWPLPFMLSTLHEVRAAVAA